MPETETLNLTWKTADEAAVRRKYARLTRLLIGRALTLTTMESCTGGQIASLITDTEGSSAVLPGAFVTYSNAAKVREGVPAEVIRSHGVYSAETAAAMAEACRKAYAADIGIGVTGSFGNADPANPDSVPGEVFFAIVLKEGARRFRCTVPALPTRLACKLFVADAVADCLAKAAGLPLNEPQEENDADPALCR